MAAHRLSNPLIPPRNEVGYLAMKWSNPSGWAYGSGALIDEQHILTCSHNLIDPLTDHVQGYALEVWFYPGHNQQTAVNPPQGGLSVKTAFFSNSFFQGEDAWDVGVCRLANPIRPKPTHFFTPMITGPEIIGCDANLTGYPGPRSGEMWEDNDDAVNGVHIATNTMIYTHDTWSGNSGSPVWTYDSITDMVNLHGIHVSRQEQELRRAVLITSNVYAWIQEALAAIPPSGPGFKLVGLQ